MAKTNRITRTTTRAAVETVPVKNARAIRRRLVRIEGDANITIPIIGGKVGKVEWSEDVLINIGAPKNLTLVEKAKLRAQRKLISDSLVASVAMSRRFI